VIAAAAPTKLQFPFNELARMHQYLIKAISIHFQEEIAAFLARRRANYLHQQDSLVLIAQTLENVFITTN